MEAEQLARSMQEMLGQEIYEQFGGLSRSNRIFRRVPPQFRDETDDWHPFDPKVVSIGPLHMGKPQLEPMQNIKWMYMERLLDKEVDVDAEEPTLNPFLKKCVSVVRGLEESARVYYSEEFPKLDKDAFTIMLVLDACFLIKFCCYSDYAEFDENQVVMLHDFLLIENQIPFDVLSAVYLSVFPSPGNEAKELVVNLRKFFFPNESFNDSIVRTNYLNLLDFYCENLYYVRCPEIHYQHMKFFLKKLLLESQNSSENSYQHSNMAKLKNYVCYPYKFFRKKLLCDQNDVGLPIKVMKTSTAAECDKAGIHIEATQRSSYIIFTNGTLTIQRIHMNQLTYSKIRNIILAEELVKYTYQPMSEYVRLLRSLVRSEADYIVLEEKGVISADSREEAMRMFHKLCLTSKALM